MGVLQPKRHVRRVLDRSPWCRQTAVSAWIMAHRVRRPLLLRRVRSQANPLWLMLGAGPAQKAGWTATDLVPRRRDVVHLDVRHPFPFADSSVDLIHSEHMIEHVTYADGAHVIRECARVLRPGGRIRLATPDFTRVVALAVGDDVDAQREMWASNRRNGLSESESRDPVHAVNRLFSGHGHRFVYTEEALRARLAAAGFEQISRQPVNESPHAELRDLESHGDRISAGWNVYQTLVVEAVQPGDPQAGRSADADAASPR